MLLFVGRKAMEITMSGLYNNGAVAAKLLAKKGRLLTDEQYGELCSLDSVAAIAGYLSKTEGYSKFVKDYQEGIHRDKLEDLIYLSLLDDYESLYSFSKGSVRNFLLLYYLKREIWIIKSAMYAVANKEESIHLSLPAHHPNIDINAIENAKSIEELASNLKNTPYYEIISEGGSIFEIETKLDKYYFDKMFEAIDNAEKDEKAAAEELVGSEADATNILWIYRAKKYYNMSPERISQTIINHYYRLKEEQVKKLVGAQTAEDVVVLTEKSHYRNILSDKVQETGNGLSAYLLDMNRKIIKKYPYAAVSSLAYIHIKRTEIQNITTIIECVRYGLPPDEAYRHVIKGCDEIGDS